MQKFPLLGTYQCRSSVANYRERDRDRQSRSGGDLTRIHSSALSKPSLCQVKSSENNSDQVLKGRIKLTIAKHGRYKQTNKHTAQALVGWSAPILFDLLNAHHLHEIRRYDGRIVMEDYFPRETHGKEL